MRYIEAEVLSEEDGSDTELVAQDSNKETDKVIEPCPTKKAKVSKRTALVEDNKCTSTNAKENKSMKPKTAKNESKKKWKSKKKKEKKGGLLKEKYVLVGVHVDCYMLRLKYSICLIRLKLYHYQIILLYLNIALL